MAETVTVKVEGLSQLGEAMRDLGYEVQNKLSRQAVRAAANVVRDNARSLAPVLAQGTPQRTPGALREAIQVRRDTKLSYPGFELMGVGVFRIGGKNFVGGKGEQSPAFYWKFVEFGTIKMSAKPFLRPGFDQEKSTAAEKMANTLAIGIERKTASYK